VIVGYLEVGATATASGMALPCLSLPTPGVLGTESLYVPIFLGRRSPERFGTVLQTSGLRGNVFPQLPNGQEQFLLFRIFKNLPKSRVVAPRTQATRARSQKNDNGKVTSPPVCKSLKTQCKGMLSTRTKMKLDVENKRLEISQ